MSYRGLALAIHLMALFTSAAGAQSESLPNDAKLNNAELKAPPKLQVQRKAKTAPNQISEPGFTRHLSLVYAQYEDKKLLCDVYVPEGKGPFPAILMIHGGAWKSGTKWHMKGHASAAAKKGFVAVSINYRHAPRYKWPAQINDCRKALDWMQQNSQRYKIDGDRISAWGYSAGGHLATYLATQNAEQEETSAPSIKCAVCGGGPVDLTMFPIDFPFLSYFLGATRRQAPEKYEEASPITHLSKNDPPIFFYHGDKDVFVPVDGVKKMVAKAKQVGVECELMLVPNKEHFLTFFDQASFDRGLEFIRKQVSESR